MTTHTCNGHRSYTGATYGHVILLLQYMPWLGRELEGSLERYPYTKEIDHKDMSRYGLAAKVSSI